MQLDPQLLAWGHTVPFDKVFKSAGEVAPLTDVAVGKWGLKDNLFSITTVENSLRTFDSHFGTLSAGAEPAMLNDMAARRAVVWANDRIVLKLEHTYVVSCWQSNDAVVCAQALPAAFVSVSKDSTVKVTACAQSTRIALLDARPLVV